MLLRSAFDMLVYEVLTCNCTTMKPISHTPYAWHGKFTKRPLAANSSQRLIATGWLHCLLLIVAGLMLSSNVLAQNFPSPNRCTSKDLELVSASITGTGCVTCIAGAPLTSDLTIVINNSTGSVRTSFAFWGTLTINNADGSFSSSRPITGCVGPVPSNAITPFSSATSSGLPKVTYTCGQSLTITSLYLAWTDAADNTNRQCPLEPSGIAPKCGTLPALAIITPLTAAVTSFTKPCTGTRTGSITVTATGGKPPYTYSLDDITYQTSATFSGLEAKSYTVYVKDASSPACKYSFTYALMANGLPAMTAPAIGDICAGSVTASLAYTAVTNSGNQYRIDWNEAANTAGLGDVATSTSPALLAGGGAITIGNTSGLAAATYSGTIYVKNSTTGCESPGAAVSLKVNAAAAGPVVIITEATICSMVTVPTLTVCNPVVGTVYEVTERDGTTLIQRTIPYVSGTLEISMRPGKGFSITATTSAGCLSSATTCASTGNIVTTCSAARVANEPTTSKAIGSQNIMTEVYPNPTSKDATINFSVPKSGHVMVSVYDAIGRPVATLFDGEALAGEQRSVQLKGELLAAGTYTYRVVANGKTKTNRVVLDK